MDTTARIRNPMFVALIPIAAITLLILFETQKKFQVYYTLIAFMFLFFYYLYWFHVTGRQLKQFNSKINTHSITLISLAFLLGSLIMILLGSIIVSITNSATSGYIPVLTFTALMILWFLYYAFTISQGFEKLTKTNKIITWMLLSFLPPIGMFIVQNYLNKYLKGELVPSN